jgi:hypothetical protein
VHAQIDQLDAAIRGITTVTTPSKTVPPLEVDLLLDTDSYTPPFYRGRALPSAGTTLHMQAIARVRDAHGLYRELPGLLYTWRQDGRVVGSASGINHATAALQAPGLYAVSTIEVSIESSDHSYAGSASITIPSNDPFVLLYENNPLLGVAYYHALGGQIAIGHTEATFTAVPYFAVVNSANDTRLNYRWTVNGSSVTASASDPSEITLNAKNSSGLASMELTISHAQNIFMDTRGSWNISLGQQSDGFGATSSSGTDFFTKQTP